LNISDIHFYFFIIFQFYFFSIIFDIVNNNELTELNRNNYSIIFNMKEKVLFKLQLGWELIVQMVQMLN